MSRYLSSMITALITGIMMKSFRNWGLALGLIGGTLIGSGLMGIMPVLALPDNQVLEKLRVPVFTIVNDKGESPIHEVTDPNTHVTAKITRVFISQQDAEDFLTQLKQKNPDLGKDMHVILISLGEIYKSAEENQKKPDKLTFSFIPVQQEMKLAGELLQINGNPVNTKDFGVPLFVANFGPNKGFLTISKGNESVIPFFFVKEDLQNLLEQVKKQQPDLVTSVNIQVVPLEGILQQLYSNDNPQLAKIELLPSCQVLSSIGVTTKPFYCLQPSASSPAPNLNPASSNSAPNLNPAPAVQH